MFRGAYEAGASIHTRGLVASFPVRQLLAVPQKYPRTLPEADIEIYEDRAVYRLERGPQALILCPSVSTFVKQECVDTSESASVEIR